MTGQTGEGENLEQAIRGQDHEQGFTQEEAGEESIVHECRVTSDTGYFNQYNKTIFFLRMVIN